MDDEPLDDPHLLKIYVAIDRPLAARDITTILGGVDRAFSRFAREEFGLRNRRLSVQQTGVDSWWVILGELFGVYKVFDEYPELIPLFVQNLDNSLKLLVDLGPNDTKRYASDLLRDLATVGRRAGAKAVTIGSRTTVRIERAMFDRIIAASRVVRPRTEQDGTATEAPTYKAFEQAGKLASEDGLPGTAFQVEGQWYLRASGLHGVLIPLFFASGKFDLTSGKTYLVEGRLRRSAENFPIGVDASAVRPLGS